MSISHCHFRPSISASSFGCAVLKLAASQNVMSREYISFSLSSALFDGLIWLFSSPEVVAVLNALNQRADVPSVLPIFIFIRPFGVLIWWHSSPEVVAVLNALNQRADYA